MKNYPSPPGARTYTGRRLSFLHLGLLALLVLLSYWRLPSLDYVHFDDDTYVVRNPVVQQGLSAASAVWAFTTFHACNYHPLTWLSHLADVSLFGGGPLGGHLTNGALHFANALLVYLFFLRTTRRAWPSFFLAALWAAHPLRVESVAWVAERKDVLSGFFWLATMHAYVWYCLRPSLARYAATLGVFTLGLLAKPMLVTLPVALALLDFWPLRRLGGRFGARYGALSSGLAQGAPAAPARSLGWALLEKLPLLALAAASSAVTLLAQQEAMGGELYTPRMRVLNALTSCVAYVAKLFWPMNLAAYYPHQGPDQSAPLAALAGLGLAAATVAALRWGRRYGYLATGWLWFLATLAPVIGLIQVGPQAMADRYTYIPHLGLCLLCVWAACEERLGLALGRRLLGAQGHRLALSALLCLLVALVGLTQRQVSFWRDGVTLFSRAAAVAPSDLAFNNLGNAHALAGQAELAEESYLRTLDLNPNHVMGMANLGVLYARQGRAEEAERLLSRAVVLEPDLSVAHAWLGALALQRRDAAGAATAFQAALALDPGNRMAQSGLAQAIEAMNEMQPSF